MNRQMARQSIQLSMQATALPLAVSPRPRARLTERRAWMETAHRSQPATQASTSRGLLVEQVKMELVVGPTDLSTAASWTKSAFPTLPVLPTGSKPNTTTKAHL